ncbi:hypothetical protein [Holdemanella biformis]
MIYPYLFLYIHYYLLGDGTMAKNQWIGSYYVGSDGCWR